MLRYELLQSRARIIQSLRRFFIDRGYLEVFTPQLSDALIPESGLEVIAAEILPSRTRGYLTPSPEYWIKQLLSMCSCSVFEIAHSFRNVEEVSPLHLTEFLMLEWYTLEAGTKDSLDHTLSLLRSFDLPVLHQEPVVFSMQEVFYRTVDINLHECIENEALLQEACHRQGLSPPDTWESAFHQLFFHCVEPYLREQGLVVLTKYPIRLPVLARKIPHTPWQDRWELFVQGVELANCYQEETDPRVIRRHLEMESHKKRRSLVSHPVDMDFLQSPVLPSCSGVALGVDRLVMLLCEIADIRDISLVPELQ